MENELDPKELARSKKAARTARISRIRRRVAIFGASLVALFSGAVLARSALDQPQGSLPGPATTASVTEIPASQTYLSGNVSGGSDDGHDSGEDHGSDDEHSSGNDGFVGVIQTATDTLSNVLNGAQTSTTAPAQSAPAPAPAPLTTSQS